MSSIHKYLNERMPYTYTTKLSYPKHTLVLYSFVSTRIYFKQILSVTSACLYVWKCTSFTLSWQNPKNTAWKSATRRNEKTFVFLYARVKHHIAVDSDAAAAVAARQNWWYIINMQSDTNLNTTFTTIYILVALFLVFV